jgi:hypothetical protein
MQASLFLVSVLLSCGSGMRVKVKSSKESSSSPKCRVLAQWICLPETWQANKPQVEECCLSSHTPEDHKANCCAFVQLANEGVRKVTVQTVAKTLVKNAAAENVVKQAPVVLGETTNEIAGAVTTQMNVTEQNMTEEEKIHEALAFLHKLWIKQKLLEMEPNDKGLVKAFYADKERGLDWSMSCVAKCEEECGSLGGEQCQPIKSSEDCEKGAKDLGKTYAPLILQKHKESFPIGCFAVFKKPNQARWNDPTPQKPTLKMSNICGCYK